MKTETRVDLIWFASQRALCLAMIVAAVLQRRRVPSSARAPGLGLVLTGGTIAAAGYRTLRQSHSAWSTPALGARLVTTGIYRHIRHPDLSGLVAGGVWRRIADWLRSWTRGWSSADGVYDIRARHEERLLLQRYPGYSPYTSSSSRFIPAV